MEILTPAEEAANRIHEIVLKEVLSKGELRHFVKEAGIGYSTIANQLGDTRKDTSLVLTNLILLLMLRDGYPVLKELCAIGGRGSPPKLVEGRESGGNLLVSALEFVGGAGAACDVIKNIIESGNGDGSMTQMQVKQIQGVVAAIDDSFAHLKGDLQAASKFRLEVQTIKKSAKAG